MQVNGKKRGDVRVPREADSKAIEAIVLADPAVQKFVERPAGEESRRRAGTAGQRRGVMRTESND